MAQNDNGGDQGRVERYDVFISYSHADAAQCGPEHVQCIKDEIQKDLDEIQKGLHDLYGISCRRLVFLDSDALEYGDEWHAKIMEKLNECCVFVCLLSENYLESTYCTRERLWWEQKEIRNGRLRQDTLPVYFIRLNGKNPFDDERSKVKDLVGFQMDSTPWFEGGSDGLKADCLQKRIASLIEGIRLKLNNSKTAERSFNTVDPPPTKSFVGRILELKALREICALNRYPVIEGGAGTGKSELAAVYAYGYASEYPQGRFLIHMEGKSRWEDAVLSHVEDPDRGDDVQSELGITSEDMRKPGKELHRLVVKKLFERAEKGPLLLLLDNVDDASLFEDRALLDFSLKKAIPANVHMIATTRHQLEFPNDNCRAQAYPLGNLDDDASFELFCEIGRNMFPFARRRIDSMGSDPECRAVMEIIRLLEGHVWSMEIIAGQMANAYGKARKTNSGAAPTIFQDRLRKLREDVSFLPGGGKIHYGYRSDAGTFKELLAPTLEMLESSETGRETIRLAYFASLLPSEGKKQDVLAFCWREYYSEVEYESDEWEGAFC
ncbi:MAG: TIR domain-containing protein, partial [Lentisphaeria bacterium]|nr:TIR domain-containing protein [Lentisphaeria bacterium]